MHLNEYGMDPEPRNNTPLTYIHETSLGLTPVLVYLALLRARSIDLRGGTGT
jgi:hypothetical protein